MLRIALKSGKVDTVANLASPEYGDAMFGEQTQQAAKVFAPNDFFGVLPDGTAWLARGHENRVDWRAPDGTWTRGHVARATPRCPVTQADRDRVLAQVREQGKQFGMPQDLAITYPFAETKPPFDFALGRPERRGLAAAAAGAGGRAAHLRRVQPQGKLAAGGGVSQGRVAGGLRGEGRGLRRRSRRRTGSGRWGGLR